MRYRLLGRSGLRVAEICLGTMTFGPDWGWGAAEAESRQMFEIYAAAGGNFIDTSGNYTEGTSERFIGRFLGDARDDFVVATKYSLRARGANQRDPNAGGNSHKTLRQSVAASLRRLNTDYIDLLYLHMWDFTTPLIEVMRGLDDLVRAGKVRYIGFSDSPAWVVSHAVALAERFGWARPVALQVPYNLARRDAERALLPMARWLDLAVLPWGVLGGGLLTGKYGRDGAEPRRYETAPDHYRHPAEAVLDLAGRLGRPPSQVAINWVRQQPGNILPIVGARTPDQLRENLDALAFQLSPDQLAALDEATDFETGFPLSFLHSDNVKTLIFGQTYEQMDHRHGGVHAL